MKKSTTLNITILGESNIPKIDLIKAYLQDRNYQGTKSKKGGITFHRTFKGDNTSMKLHFYEFSELPDKKGKDIATHQCIIIMFDMSTRKNFEDVLDKWIKFLREIKYSNSIILFGTTNPENPNALHMTDEEEIQSLIEVTEIKGKFYYIGDKTEKEKCDLIDVLIETSYEEAKNNINKKDCIIF